MENIVCIDDLLQDVIHLRCPNYQVSIYVREKLHNDFMDFLGGKGINPCFEQGCIDYRYDELLRIAAVMYRNRYQDNAYRKEHHDPVVTAMKFKAKKQSYRVYCQEIASPEEKIIILCEIHVKKSNENRNTERNIIKKVAGYEFTLLT